jgi:hypothetical protein
VTARCALLRFAPPQVSKPMQEQMDVIGQIARSLA